MTMLPAATDFTGATITEGQFKTAITDLRSFLYEKLGSDGSVPIQAFAAGTLMLFQQTSAPDGWTKKTTHNDKVLRVVSGTASSGGSHAFSTVFGKTVTDSMYLSAAQSGMPSHTHTMGVALSGSGGSSYWNISEGTYMSNTAANTGSAGGSGASSPHDHGMDIRVQYVDLIIAEKN